MNSIILYLFKKATNYLKYTGAINYISNNKDFHINQVDKRLWVSNLPTIEHKDKIKHINTVISFISNDEYGHEETKWIDKTNKKYYRIPVTDYTPPSQQDYDKLKKILEQEKGHILIHCYAGKGSSNCGACIFMITKRKMNNQQAIDHIRKKLPRSGMNQWQVQSVLNYKN